MYVDLEVEGRDPFFWTNLEYPQCHLDFFYYFFPLIPFILIEKKKNLLLKCFLLNKGIASVPASRQEMELFLQNPRLPLERGCWWRITLYLIVGGLVCFTGKYFYVPTSELWRVFPVFSHTQTTSYLNGLVQKCSRCHTGTPKALVVVSGTPQVPVCPGTPRLSSPRPGPHLRVAWQYTKRALTLNQNFTPRSIFVCIF